MELEKPKILWIGDKARKGHPILKGFEECYSIENARTTSDCLNRLQKHDIFTVLLQMDDPSLEGMEILRSIKNNLEGIDVITLTKKKKVEEAIQVIQEGAFDYLDLIEDQPKIEQVIERSLENQDRKNDIHNLRSKFSEDKDLDIIFGKSPQIKNNMKTLERVSSLQTTVLLHGESGTGKEITARLIHKKSHLKGKPFITVNLPSIPSNLVESVLFGHEKGSFTGAYRRHFGKFELAHGGTIFLDEIGDLDFDVQSKLLRVIQEGEIERVGGTHPIKIEVRLIAASKIDLYQAVKAGKFRDDLFYRLNVIPIHLPPLRQRLEDIPDFCNLFIKKYSKKFGKNTQKISSEALQVLKRCRWPGNIRELENLMERIVAMMDPNALEIKKGDIPLEYYFSRQSEVSLSGTKLNESLVLYERKLVIKSLKQNNWNRKKTAQELGITYGILKYKIRKFNIEIPGRRIASRSSKK